MATCWSYTFLTKRKTFAQYRWCTYSWWQFTLIPVVIPSEMTYESVVSVPTEKYKYIGHTSPLIPQVAPTRLTLRGLLCMSYENVFTSCRRHPQDIPKSPRPRCVVMVSRMTDTQPYHTIETTLKQASS
jgi:hypothetical protein